MSTVSAKKQDIFGGIAALKAITDQSLNKTNRFIGSTVGEANNIMLSLLEIFNQLGGYDELIQTIENYIMWSRANNKRLYDNRRGIV